MEERNTTGMSWITLVAAVWLMSAPFFFTYRGTIAQTNDIWVGMIIGVSSLVRILAPKAARFFNWINLLGGLWLMSSPFILGYLVIAARWNDVVLGLVVLAISLMNFGRSQSSEYKYRYRHYSRPLYR